MRPVIGVTCSVDVGSDEGGKVRAYVNAAYTDAIFAAGGLAQPIVAPPDAGPALFAELADRFDGFLFTGGADLDPRHYGQARHEKTHVMHDRRDALELEMFRAADQSGKPILAICLGCQVANVGRGGCLVQHVDDLPRDSEIEHHRPGGASAFHDVEVEPGSRLAQITGKQRFEVNSRHHQVLDREKVGGRLRAVAFAPDGCVEAAEATDDRFLIAVQWHPEDLVDRPEHLKLFEALVAAAGEKRDRVKTPAARRPALQSAP